VNFADFQNFRDRVLRERSHVLDCAATNLYGALPHLIPAPTPAPACTLHRRDLALEWTRRFGFPVERARHALVSDGVRDSLAHIFRHYAAENARLWLPADNYPVYHEIAHAAGLEPSSFPTLPEPDWPDGNPEAFTEILVVTNPLKPRGRWLTPCDMTALTAWLAAHPRRRLILDAVYTFDTLFHATTLQLLATGQTFLLHSLTKGWLHPRLFGIALAPADDAKALAPVFRAHPPPQLNLGRARAFLIDYAETPTAVAHELAAAHERMIATLPAGLPTPMATDATGYLFPITCHWLDLLNDFGILAIPATVFGSVRDDMSILSSLQFPQVAKIKSARPTRES
jgi:aspartate/methionine/tyrosine aminotransferase